MRYYCLLVYLVSALVAIAIYQACRNYRMPSNPMKIKRYEPKLKLQNTTHRNYFNNTHLTEFGVYPLPKGNNHTVTERNYDSPIPEMYFRTYFRSMHNFKWIINQPLFCIKKSLDEPDELFLLVTVASAIWEVERREIIRKTWGSVSLYKNKVVKYAFFVGYSEKYDSTIRKESDKYSDIIMEDFSETYKNLTIKTQAQLKWITHFCSNTKYVLHIDDDVVPDIFKIISYLIETSSQNVIHCAKWFAPTVRREGKWEVTIQEYSKPTYPLSCYGWCYAMPTDVAIDLYYTSLRSHLLYLEDVMFTGILRTRVGINIMKMTGGEALCKHKGWPKDRPTNEKLLEAWADIQKENTS